MLTDTRRSRPCPPGHGLLDGELQYMLGQRPISLVCSICGMNCPGGTRPRRGWSQRSSASTARMSPLRRSASGWYSSRSWPSSSARPSRERAPMFLRRGGPPCPASPTQAGDCQQQHDQPRNHEDDVEPARLGGDVARDRGVREIELDRATTWPPRSTSGTFTRFARLSNCRSARVELRGVIVTVLERGVPVWVQALLRADQVVVRRVEDAPLGV